MDFSANNTPRQLPPEGTHTAVLYSIVDLGTQKSTFNGETKIKRKMRLSFELSDERMEDGRPFSISKEYTQSSHEKAVIVKDVKSWTGEKLGPDFNPKSLIGRACNLTIAHDHKDENTYANIMGIAPLKKNEQAPAMQNKALYFDLDAFDLATFNALPEYLQTKIKGAPEYIEAVNRMNNPDAYAQPTAQAGAEKTVDLDDSIPF